MTEKLTRAEIAAMTAPQLRLAVAVNIFDAKWVNAHPGKILKYPDGDIAAYVYSSGHETWEGPDYPGDIGAAMLVVEKLENDPREILFSCERKGYNHNTLKWWVRFRECQGSQRNYYAIGDTLSEAICRAALYAALAAESEKEK